MESIYVGKITELKREKPFLEKKLNVKISIKGKLVTFSGDPLDEYEASNVLDAISIGFPAQTAVTLIDEDFLYEKINIKEYSGNRRLDVVRGRLIGTHGKTKKTIEQISGCNIVIKDHTVGIIGPAEKMDFAITAIANIIKGSKQTNVYKYLERVNTQTKNIK